VSYHKVYTDPTLKDLAKQGQQAYSAAYYEQKENNELLGWEVKDPVLVGRIAQITFLHEHHVRYHLKLTSIKVAEATPDR